MQEASLISLLVRIYSIPTSPNSALTVDMARSGQGWGLKDGNNGERADRPWQARVTCVSGHLPTISFLSRRGGFPVAMNSSRLLTSPDFGS